MDHRAPQYILNLLTNARRHGFMITATAKHEKEERNMDEIKDELEEEFDEDEDFDDEELELSDEQAARNDEIYNAAFAFCQVLTENPDLEWDMQYLGCIADFAAA